MSGMKRKMIIDCDAGNDDAQAIMLALSHPDIDVIGITCVTGNVRVDQVCLNVLRVLKACDRLDVPVFKGSGKTMLGNIPDRYAGVKFHGHDGMGDAPNPLPVDIDMIQTEHAVQALVRLADQYPGEVTLVALAPLTNIALALRLDPGFCTNLKDVVIVGGNTAGRGNTTPAAEFNFISDPEAAFVTINELKCPIITVDWEICLKAAVTKDWLDMWLNVDTQKGRFNRDISEKTLFYWEKPYNEYNSCDLAAMAVAVDKSVASEFHEVYVTVELSGTVTRGQMVVDWRGVLDKPHNMKIVQSYDLEKAKEMFYNMLL